MGLKTQKQQWPPKAHGTTWKHLESVPGSFFGDGGALQLFTLFFCYVQGCFSLVQQKQTRIEQATLSIVKEPLALDPFLETVLSSNLLVSCFFHSRIEQRDLLWTIVLKYCPCPPFPSPLKAPPRQVHAYVLQLKSVQKSYSSQLTPLWNTNLVDSPCKPYVNYKFPR